MVYNSVFGALTGYIQGTSVFSYSVSTMTINMTMNCIGTGSAGAVSPGTVSQCSCT